MFDLAQARHVVELMVVTAWADGHVEGTEALAIHKLIAVNPLLREVGPSGEISKATRARLEQLGLEGSVAHSARGIHDLTYREVAFQCCARVTGADGDFAAAEARVLGDLQELFGFTPDDVRRLLVLSTR